MKRIENGERRGFRRVITLLITALVCSAALSPRMATAADKLIFGNSNPGGLNISWGPLYYAMAMGFLKDEGIDLDQVILPGTTLFPQVANKSVDIGWAGPGPVIISHDTGHDPYPVKFFYNQLRREIYEIVVPADSKIKSVADLKGATIGVILANASNIPATASVLRGVGIDPQKDVSFLPVGIGPTAFHAIRTGQVDALNLYDTAHVLLELGGFEIRRLEMPQSFTSLFENGFFTNVDNLPAKRDLFARFGRALAKGTIGCYANLPACVRISWQQDPKIKPADRPEADSLKEALATLEIRRKSLFDFPQGARGHWGAYDDAGWKDWITTLYDNHVLKTDAIDVASLYTNDLVPAMNAFDTDAVVKQAEALK